MGDGLFETCRCNISIFLFHLSFQHEMFNGSKSERPVLESRLRIPVLQWFDVLIWDSLNQCLSPSCEHSTWLTRRVGAHMNDGKSYTGRCTNQQQIGPSSKAHYPISFVGGFVSKSVAAFVDRKHVREFSKRTYIFCDSHYAMCTFWKSLHLWDFVVYCVKPKYGENTNHNTHFLTSHTPVPFSWPH